MLNSSIAMLKGAERSAAMASSKMDFSHPDAAPEELLNQILWHHAKGWNVSYPSVPHIYGCLPTDDD
jgi:hypothetical protein